jgi:hypothetical protein
MISLRRRFCLDCSVPCSTARMPASAISVSCDCFASKFRVRAIRLLHSGLGVGGGGDAKIQVRKYVCEMCHLFVALFAAWSVFTKEFQQNALAHMAMVAKFFTSTTINQPLWDQSRFSVKTYMKRYGNAKHCAFLICQRYRLIGVWRMAHHSRNNGSKLVGHDSFSSDCYSREIA